MVLTACGAGEDEKERWEMEDGTVVYVEPEVRDMFLVDDDAFLLTEVSLELLLLDTDEEVLLDTDEPDISIEPSSEMLSLSWFVEDARLPMTLSACNEYSCPLMVTLYASMRLNLPESPELVLNPFEPKVSATSLYFHTYWLGTSTCAFDWSLSTG